MVQDYGSGLTIDDLIGKRVTVILEVALPHSDLALALTRAARMLVENDDERAVLLEIWGDGHTVWQITGGERILVVSPTGQIKPDWP